MATVTLNPISYSYSGDWTNIPSVFAFYDGNVNTRIYHQEYQATINGTVVIGSLDDLTVDVSEINKITINYYVISGRYQTVAKSGTVYSTIIPSIWVNSSWYNGTTFTTEDYPPNHIYTGWLAEEWTVNPATGNPFTVSDINNIQLRTQHKSVAGSSVYAVMALAEITLEVDYVPIDGSNGPILLI